MTPSYVVQSDLENYIEGWVTSDVPALLRLLERAEHYIDLCCATRRMRRPGAVQLLTMDSYPTGGSFQLAFSIYGQTYNSASISYNAAASSVASAIMAGGAPGSLISYAPGQDANAPIYTTPVVICFGGSLSGVPIAAGTCPINSTGAVVTLSQMAPGGPIGVGKRFDPANLRYHQLQALKNAVCAQAEYMFKGEDSLFSGAQYQSVKGPDFQTQGRLPVVAPKAKRELAMGGLAVGIGRAR